MRGTSASLRADVGLIEGRTMSAKWERSPGEPRGSHTPLQRSDPEDSDEWLAGVATVEADVVDRLAGDADLVTSLELRNFEGPWWDYFANELAKYGVAVWRAWLGTGVVYQRCKQKGCAIAPLGRPFTQEEIDDLAMDTVAEAIKAFRTEVLMRHRWDPSRGASLRTFFIGQCIFRFRNIYRNHRRALERDFDLVVDDLGALDRGAPSPEKQVVDMIEAEEALMGITDPRVRRAIVMTARGHTQQQIADELGVTAKTVERMMANERSRLRRRAG